MLKIAVVGCGGIGMTHAKILKEIDDVIIEAFVDLDIDRAQKGVDMYNGKALNSIDKIPEGIDGVTVAAQPLAHYKITKSLLEKGFNVFCEKPLTMETETCEELDALAKKNNCILMVGFKMRYEPLFKKAKELLPQIGKLISLSSTKQQPYNSRPENNWFPKVGAMFELSVHDFDLIHWMAGIKPEKVLFSELSHRLGWEREDAFYVTVKYTGGVIGQLQGMYALENKFSYRDFSVTFLGEKGYLRVERPDRVILNIDEYSVHEVDPKEVNAFSEELKHFCNVIQGKEENTLTAESGTNATFIADKAFQLSNKEN
jgi:myo-inositol 2-dehydrogenase / D-chiro-inositol 1-dehydrogenase